MLNFDYRSLVAAPQDLAGSPESDAASTVAHVRAVIRRKGHKRRLPTSLLLSTDDLSTVADDVVELLELLPTAGAVVARIFEAPPVVFPLIDGTSQDGRRVERIAVACAFTGPTVPSGLIAVSLQLEVTNKGHGMPRVVTSKIWHRQLGGRHSRNISALRIELERLFAQRKLGIPIATNTDASLRPGTATLIVASEQAADADRENPGWTDVVRGVGFVQGIDFRHIRPLATIDRMIIQHAVHGAKGVTPSDILVAWGVPYDPRLGALISEWSKRRSSDTVTHLATPTVVDFVGQLREELEVYNDIWGELERLAPATPVSAEAVSRQLPMMESPAFIITENGHAQWLRSGYPDPARMLHHVTQLAMAAEEFAARRGELGTRLEDWIRANYGIEIALHDDSLRGRHIFTFDGREYSREPHVKVDDAKPANECGRIYFAVDGENLRFIVDHIGLHL